MHGHCVHGAWREYCIVAAFGAYFHGRCRLIFLQLNLLLQVRCWCWSCWSAASVAHTWWCLRFNCHFSHWARLTISIRRRSCSNVSSLSTLYC